MNSASAKEILQPVQAVMDEMLENVEKIDEKKIIFKKEKEENKHEKKFFPKEAGKKDALEVNKRNENNTEAVKGSLKINETEKRIVLKMQEKEKKNELVEKGSTSKKRTEGEDGCRKRKLGGRQGKCKLQFSSSSDESIVIIESPNDHSIFSSPLSCSGGSSGCGYGGSGSGCSGGKDNRSPKIKCQCFRRCEELLPVCVVKPFIGPQLPHIGTIFCPPVRLTNNDGVKKMRRMALKKEVEELLTCKLMLLKSLMLRKKQLEQTDEEVRRVTMAVKILFLQVVPT